MAASTSRYQGVTPATAADSWTIERLTSTSRLFGANGLRTGADGRIYVAQVSGSQVSAIHPDTGEMETVSQMGSRIVCPDDLVFDESGNLYLTEITEGRVSMRSPNGATRVIHGDMPVANPITYHHGRLIAGECRMGGRIMELDRNGGAARVILSDVPMANAMEVGPDGKLYMPIMATNEIWRVGLDGGAPEVVARNLGVPDSVKFDPNGFIVSTQVQSGEVLRIDPRTGEKTVLARLSPGLDNCTFLGNRLFVSNMSGYIVEVLDQQDRNVVPDGFNWPLGLAMGDDGALFIADGPFSFTLTPDRQVRPLGMLFSPGYPGYTRGVGRARSGGFVVTTGSGEVFRYWPEEQRNELLAKGFDQLYGVAQGRGDVVVFAELGGGRLMSYENGTVTTLASGLDQPKGVAFGADDRVYVSESGGRVVEVTSRGRTVVLDGLQKPEGLAFRDGTLFVVDAGSKNLLSIAVNSGRLDTLASNLPVGAPAGIVPVNPQGVGAFSGPAGPFAAIAVDAAGTLYLSGDAEGSVLALRPALAERSYLH